MLIIPNFQKSLIVEQFQGNYLKHARFLDADGNRKRTFRALGQWHLPDFYTNHL